MGPGIWKLNTSLLYDNDCVKFIIITIIIKDSNELYNKIQTQINL